MAMHGSLKDMSVADIIQHNCQDQKTALLTVDNGLKKAQIYFKSGAVVHALMDQLVGEEVVFQALSWADGKFILEMGVASPAITIRRSWSSLLLEGAKQIDEQQEDLFGLELETPASKDSALNDQLSSFLEASKFFRGVAICDPSGDVRAIQSNETLEKELIGSIAAATYSFGRRSLQLIRQGKPQTMVIQGDAGTLYISSINSSMLFFGLAAQQPDFSKLTDEINQLKVNLGEK